MAGVARAATRRPRDEPGAADERRPRLRQRLRHPHARPRGVRRPAAQALPHRLPAPRAQPRPRSAFGYHPLRPAAPNHPARRVVLTGRNTVILDPGVDMSPVFKKLNLKHQGEIVVVNAPLSFEPELRALEDVSVLRDPKDAEAIHFALAFVTRQAEVDALSKVLAGKAEGDALVWFAYPKGTSRRYRCDFNRDTGWDVMRSLGFDTVRQVAIDDDWSALRFRRVE